MKQLDLIPAYFEFFLDIFFVSGWNKQWATPISVSNHLLQHPKLVNKLQAFDTEKKQYFAPALGAGAASGPIHPASSPKRRRTSAQRTRHASSHAGISLHNETGHFPAAQVIPSSLSSLGSQRR